MLSKNRLLVLVLFARGKMVDVRTTTGNYPKDPYEDLKVQQIEKARLEKEEAKAKELKKRSRAGYFIWIQMLLFLKKLAGAFASTKPKEELKEKAMVADLEKLKGAFEKLKTVDFSQDVPYLNFLSQTWHNFLDDAATIKKDEPFFAKLEEFIEQVQEYPHGQEHSLGYYLAEFAGSEWLPFPFMELLARLHEEHTSVPEVSHLKRWTELLKSLIEEIKVHG